MIPVEKWKGMKVLTVREPWAWLIVMGLKDVENRSWDTKYRGPVLIHASANVGEREWDAASAWVRERFPWILLPAYSDARRKWFGKILGGCEIAGMDGRTRWRMEDSRFGWELRNAWHVDGPLVAAKGKLGLWTYEG